MSQWIAGIARGHNGGICLLKDGEIVFAIEEERFSRAKYDGGPYASMIKVLDYTDKLDFLAIAHTQPDTSACDFSGDTVYAALARKLRLIEGTGNKTYSPANGQIIDMHLMHHKTHAACAFYRSGFETATAVIVDGAGTFIPISVTTPNNTRDVTWEVESIFDCSYPNNFRTLYKHQGGNGPYPSVHYEDMDSAMIPGGQEQGEGTHELIIDDSPGIVKAYEAVTEYCGWNAIEAGKTMGLFPYGKPNDNIPNIYTTDGGEWRTADKNVIIPTYPNGAMVNSGRYTILQNDGQEFTKGVDLTKLQNRRDMAYAVQTESQQLVLELIRKAVEISGNKNVVLSGGYGLNCVANYWYLEQLKDEDINLYVEPISSDAGTAMGAALLVHYNATGDFTPRKFGESLFLGPEQKNSTKDIVETAKKYNATGVFDGQHIKDAINLILQGNIVALFQGRSESGPRALGNRSILFDPRTLDGKDHVNKVKRREYFRPFAGSILHEHANDWFDMRGMEESPHMMYAVNCKTEDHAKQIPAIIHIDGTCRIQTVKKHQNPIYYEIIDQFYKETGVPIIFNTSFNLGGEPLVETIDDAIHALAESDLEYLYIPENELIIEVSNNN